MPPETAAAKQPPIQPATIESLSTREKQMTRSQRAKTANAALASTNVETGSGKRKITTIAAKHHKPTTRITKKMSVSRHQSIIGHDIAPQKMVGQDESPTKSKFARKISIVQMPTTSAQLRTLSVHSMIFLESRPMHPDIGTMVLSLEDGNMQLWSHHALGGYKATFVGIHTAGDYVSCMATDPDNDYLFTGTTAGYLKIWLMTNYGYFNKESPTRTTSLPVLRLRFPFLWHDRMEGRAKRSVRQQPLPVLLSSHKAHLSTILSVQYLAENKIIITASSDRSVRLWTLGGRYIHTLGTTKQWEPIPEVGPIPTNFPFRSPPDIKRSASFTTLKVLEGGDGTISFSREHRMEDARKEHTEVGKRRIFGKPLQDPILGHHFQLPQRGELRGKPILDTSLPYIPVYSHLDVHELRDRPRPPTPEIIRAWRRNAQNTYVAPEKVTTEIEEKSEEEESEEASSKSSEETSHV